MRPGRQGGKQGHEIRQQRTRTDAQIQSSCFDVEHKKRGRPPLRPEDGTSKRSFDTALSPLPTPYADPSRRLPPAGPSTSTQPAARFPQGLRPIQTDLPRDTNRPIRPTKPPHQAFYTTSSLPSGRSASVGATPSTSGTYSRESPLLSSQSQTVYSAASSTLAGTAPETAARAALTYGSPYNYGAHLLQMPPPTQPPYPYSIFPRSSTPGTTPVSNTSTVYPNSSLQLPPILPAPQGSPREPAMAQQQRQNQQQGYMQRMPQQQHQHQHEPLGPSQSRLSHDQQQHYQQTDSPRSDDSSTRQPQAKRPRMDIKGILDPDK